MANEGGRYTSTIYESEEFITDSLLTWSKVVIICYLFTEQRVAEEKEAKKLAAEKAAQILDEESVAKDTETSSVNEQVLRTDNLVEDEALPMSEKFNKRENMDQHISEEDSCMESNTIHKDDVSLEEK